MSKGDGRQEGARVRRGPVFELPPLPDVGSGRSRGLVRIVDPVGLAVAWFDPGSARCMEFMVRSLDEDRTAWRSVFAVPDAQEMDARSAGCWVLAVGGDSGSRITGDETGDDWPGAEWRLLQRDPTSVILQAALPEKRGADAGDVSARLVAQLDEATLSLSLTVQNDGAVARLVAFGLRVGFPPGVMNGSRLLKAQEEGERDRLRLPVGSDATWDRASHVVVTCEEGVRYLGPQAGGAEGSPDLAMLGAAPGEPALLLAGACARLAISIAVVPLGEDVPQ